MPTVLDLAKMARAVYKPSPEVDGWTRIKFQAASGVLDGFQAAAFSGPGGVVVAFRGSAQGEDWAVNAGYAVGLNTIRFASAESFVTAAAEGFAAQSTAAPAKLFLTGHSLGGAITQIVGNRKNLPFVTFNAPGVAVVSSRNFDEMAIAATTGMMKVRLAGMVASAVVQPGQAWRDAKAAFRRVHGLNVCLNADRVSDIGVHYGKVVRIAGPSYNPLTAHKMDSVLKALEGDTAAKLAPNKVADTLVENL